MRIHIGFDVLLEVLPRAAFLLGKGYNIDVNGTIKLLGPQKTGSDEGENDNDNETVSHVHYALESVSSELGDT
jgi:hypothetical protein